MPEFTAVSRMVALSSSSVDFAKYTRSRCLSLDPTLFGVANPNSTRICSSPSSRYRDILVFIIAWGVPKISGRGC